MNKKEQQTKPVTTGADLKAMARGLFGILAESDQRGAALLVDRGIAAGAVAYPCWRNLKRDPIGFIARLDKDAADNMADLITELERGKS